MKEIKNIHGDTFPIVSKGKSLRIAKKIRESLEARTFIEMVLKDDDTLTLLCVHHSTLSPSEKFNFPLLCSINRGKKVKSKLPFALVTTKETTKAQHTIERIIERAKPTLETLFEKFRSKYSTLLEDIDVENESLIYHEEKEQQILGMIITQIIVQDLGDEEKILKIIKMFEDILTDDVVPILLMFLNSLKKEFIDFGIKNKEKIISASKLDEEIYKETINRLETKYKVIKPLISIFWCENERHDHFSFFTLTHALVPDIKCPICSKKLSVGTFYYFIPDINYLLRSKEGLIQSLTMYMLNKTEQDWLPSVYLAGINNDTEKDIVVEKNDGKYTLIEIKNFATDVSPRTKKEHFKQLLNQALKHLDTYLKLDVAIDSIYLVTNYGVDDEIREVINNLLPQNKFKKLNEIGLKVFGPNNIQKLGDD